MEIIGRLTRDAEVKTLSDERQVVSFSIAINDFFKTKNGERKNVTTYVKCSYWISTKIAGQLIKGSIVSLFGRIDINAYTKRNGEFVAELIFHVNAIKIVAKGKGEPVELVAATEGATKDDLPF